MTLTPAARAVMRAPRGHHHGRRLVERGDRMTTARPGRLAALAVILTAGCGGVDRRFVVESNVPGAQVFLDRVFLGAAPDVEYHPLYHPFNWRGWVDWGQGALGDMGAHLIDHPVWGLKLPLPNVIVRGSAALMVCAGINGARPPSTVEVVMGFVSSGVSRSGRAGSNGYAGRPGSNGRGVGAGASVPGRAGMLTIGSGAGSLDEQPR